MWMNRRVVLDEIAQSYVYALMFWRLEKKTLKRRLMRSLYSVKREQIVTNRFIESQYERCVSKKRLRFSQRLLKRSFFEVFHIHEPVLL